MAKKLPRLRLSKTSLEMYLQCPKSYFYAYVERLPSRPDYPRLVGVEVHKFIAKMRSSRKNPLYFKSIDTARGAWFYAWKKAMETAHPTMLRHTKQEDDKFGELGWICVRNFWNHNINRPQPKYVEKRFEMPLFPGVIFSGIMDQVSELEIKTIANIRPELVVNGELAGGYNPEVIVDLKTVKKSYDPREFEPDISPQEMAMYQAELHNGIQATAYYWLYFQVFKKMPVGFYWYHLRTNKAFLTIRTEKDFENFKEIAMYVANGIFSHNFPEHYGHHCRWCDYYEQCRGGLVVSEPSNGVEFGGKIQLWPKETPPKYKQLRFKFPNPTIGRSSKTG